MGLTKASVGTGAVDTGLVIKKQSEGDKVIALAGNPNVGKSTVFNALTGLNQHTGNWPGKTVANAQGYCKTKKGSYVLVDIPGTYSLMAHSAEEEVARNFICFDAPDATVVVCDATCLERNLNLVLQTMEISKKVIVCINLMDEAQRKHIEIDAGEISRRLGVPVVTTEARRAKSLKKLTDAIDKICMEEVEQKPYNVPYPKAITDAAGVIEEVISGRVEGRINARWLSIKMLEQDSKLLAEIHHFLGKNLMDEEEVREAVQAAREILRSEGIDGEALKDMLVSTLVGEAENICRGTVTYDGGGYGRLDRAVDKILTSRLTGYPVMILLLALVFWITISGANYPTMWLSSLFGIIEGYLTRFFTYIGAPPYIHGAFVEGIYRVLTYVVSVMLPPMAIFFPLFTLLEDSGYLPRVAYNLDKPFFKCRACGKQALTMCMGFGCNAAGVIGCRIIDSPRERMLAILTNNFVPCNGRFPTLIAIIGMFFAGGAGAAGGSLLSAALLTLIILIGIFMTFAVTRILSGTLLSGMPSFFAMELPPYRRPQIGKVLVRSVFDRTLFVLGRAAAVAAPAGLIIWLSANVFIGDISLLNHAAAFLDPFARLMGLDGVILIAFILGFPANEIVLPIIIMAYTAQGSIADTGSLTEMKRLFIENGWTWITAVNMMLFSLMHWPCSTTLITIKRETKSAFWTVAAALIPTAAGIIICMLTAAAARLFV